MKIRAKVSSTRSGKTIYSPIMPVVSALFVLLFISITVVAVYGGGQLELESESVKHFKNADKLFGEENWAEARAEYDLARGLESDWHSPQSRLAVERAVVCSVKLQKWDDAIERAEKFIEETAGSFEEAVGRRFLGGIYLTIPHHGTKRGGTFLRGQYSQGVQVNSWRRDRRSAIRQYEQAREILIGLAEKPFDDVASDAVIEAVIDAEATKKMLIAERIGVSFDLVTALANRGPNRYNQWGMMRWWWDSLLEGEEDSEAMEEADYDEPRWGRHNQDQTPPSGIPLGPDGKPAFITVPDEYGSGLGDGVKIRFILNDIQRLDTTKTKDHAAKALLRWAMMTRSLYGPDTARQWKSSQVQYDRFGKQVARDAKSDESDKEIWELGDDEAITVAGGRLRVVTLPARESLIALVGSIEKNYPQSNHVAEACYVRALYFQTRKQFPRAIAEYKKLISRFPKHKRAGDANNQIEMIQQPDLHLHACGVQLPGAKPKLSFSYRNTDEVGFKAYKFDMVKYARDRMEKEVENYWNYRHFQSNLFYDQKRPWKEYQGEEIAAWSETVEKKEANHAATGSTLTPLSEPGAYVVEARTDGKSDPSYGLVLVTDIAIVQKKMVGKGLIYIADARTGQPLADKAVRIYEHWRTHKNSKSKMHWDSSVLTTNAEGVIEYSRKKGSQVDAIVTGDDDRMSFSFFQNWNEHDPRPYNNEKGPRYYIITDRPAYRSGDTVKFSVWFREMADREYKAPSALRRHLTIYDSRNNEVQKITVAADSQGCASGEFKLGDEPPLGVYHIRIGGYRPDARRVGGGLFRVEEYKLPEFEVTVKSATTQARLGDKIKAKIQAKYYFGAPVAHGNVTYKVFRENYNHVYVGKAEYDWLYGKGYGRYNYAYPWLGWWGHWGHYVCGDFGWPYLHSHYGRQYSWGYYGDDQGRWRNRYGSGTRKALRELVAQGKAKLKKDGTFEIEIDTADAKAQLPDRDHRYTVEAEVRDASRRTIEGTGSVVATRREFYAFVETNGGWYKPGNEVFVDVRTLTADNVPVAVKGDIVVYRTGYGRGADNGAGQEEVKRWAGQTDGQGRLEFKYPIPGEGQYRIVFETKDSQGQEVLGNAVFWSAGAEFTGKVYRFNDLEVIADKRTYKVGDIAHLLINVAESNARILFSDDVSDGTLFGYRFIDIESRSKVIDVPITRKHVPNFFVEATLVRNGRVHMENRQLLVPPVEGLLNVAIKTDKETYKPGEKGLVKVELSDYQGKPVSGSVTLSAYDRAVTYIQEEFGPSPQVFFYGQKRYHTPYVSSSTSHSFNTWGRFRALEHQTYQGGEPEGWRGYWGLDGDGLTLSGVMCENSSGPLGSIGGYSRRMDSFEGAMKSEFGKSKASGALRGKNYISKVSFDLADSAVAVGEMVGGEDSEMSQAQQTSGSGGKDVEPEIRTNFSDTALWLAVLKTDEDGKAETEITFPQSLTTWKVRGYAITNATQVGDATTEAITTKNLIVRLQAPRFFMERDEVVLSANVHNYLKTSKKVTAELILPKELFGYIGRIAGKLEIDEDGNYHLYAKATVKANGEHRFDWPIKVKKEGFARITVKAMTDEESDGMRMAFPVLIHGINKTIAQSGSYRVDQEGERVLKVDLPEEIDPEQTKLELTLSPSLGGVMIDALPYLVGYPYGCVEQTMSRFYPTVLVAGTLKKMGLDLETIGAQRRQMNKGDLNNRFGKYQSPVFNTKEKDRMVKAGLTRIYSFQQTDGGWGWWREESSPYQTAYVLQGLDAARKAGVRVENGVYNRGMYFLRNFMEKELEKPVGHQRVGSMQTQAYIAYILSLGGQLRNDDAKEWLESLYESRGKFNNYGRCLLAMAMHNEKHKDRAKLLLRNVLQFVDKDDSNDTAWVRTPQQHWWFWWNNDIETNAWALRAMMAIDPENDLAPRLVKWLLNNRRSGYYWRSTRDTALVIAAMTEYMIVSGEADPDYELTVNIDGRPVRDVKISKENLFTFDNRIALYGLQVKPGPHTITLSKKGKGALYYSCYLSYFTKEEDVKGAGNEIFVKREYYKLIPRAEEVKLADPAVAATQSGLHEKPLNQTGRTELRAGYKRVPLVSGDVVNSGDKIEVVLKITAKNTYDYLAFEDMKPAGCEPVEIRSGGRWAGGVCSHVEFRDEKVVFYVGLLEQGEHVLRYKLRAEIPGVFHALPATGFAMYAPEVRAISDEMRIGIVDVDDGESE